MDRLVRAKVLAAEVEALGLTIEDLVAATTATNTVGSREGSAVSTVAEYVERVAPTFADGTRQTYQSYWKLLVARFGDHPIDQVGYDGCELVVADAERRARELRGSDGRGARENCVAALRALFKRAVRARLVSENPALEIDKPRRLPNRRRGLTGDEVDEIVAAVRTTSRDPDLDLLLVQFHLESGARREGALNLVRDGIDRRRCTVWLDEKFSQEREQPISPSLIQRIAALAASRGAAEGGDKVFRTRGGRPISRRRYNTLFDHVQAALPWTVRTPVTAHVLRHTAATAVERVAGEAVAEAFLGHKPATYTRALIGEVASAVALLTGEPHPLAETRDLHLVDTATPGRFPVQTPAGVVAQGAVRPALTGAGRST